MISVKEKIVMEKYSKGPNLIAILARGGEISIKAKRLIMVPRKEKTIPIPRAFPACPFAAIGCPSRQVAMEAGVPGIFSKIAEIRPPEIPPIYNAIRTEIPCVAAILYVTGRNMAMAMVAVSPGIQPKMIPTKVPMNTQTIQMGFIKTEANPSASISRPPF